MDLIAEERRLGEIALTQKPDALGVPGEVGASLEGFNPGRGSMR